MTTTRNSERAYGKSIIYKICCNDLKVKDVYVGSTTNFKNRKNQHKSVCRSEKSPKYNLKVYRYIRNNGGWSNFDMIQLEQYDAKTKLELHARERYWVETLKATLNCQIPTRTHSEYLENNKELITKQNKEYYEENKKKIAERFNEKFTCKCGGKYTRVNKLCHQKTKIHSAYLKLNNNVIVDQCAEQNQIEFQK